MSTLRQVSSLDNLPMITTFEATCQSKSLLFKVAAGIVVTTSLISTAAKSDPLERELVAKSAQVSTPKPRPKRPNEPTIQPEPKAKSKAESKSTRKPPASREALRNDAKSITARACLVQLRKIADAKPAPHPKTSEPGCRIPSPVALISTKPPYSIRFTDGLILDCPFALKLATFTSHTVQALARHHLKSPVTSIVSGQGFVCRRRNNATTGKLSDHAFGNALDLVGFEFANDERLNIKDPGKMKPSEADYFNSLRSAACGTFTTVLGPGSDAAHATHLHIDLARSKDKKNPYRICE